ncbi:Alcohol dehydrogenase 2 [Symmachiella dynata]|uniref:iron-containing alcohol dehydrogenase n=1 Tax=Symmachiella dynata TaxID=2527995 RepID=UPI001188B44F|nr:iron-containing alcohol dehydrogenase [Symmachiella dynata]QDT47157.1 Alcohol dehydrogenase 2 [Symmachiella dynata]
MSGSTNIEPSQTPRPVENGRLVPFDYAPRTRVVFGPGTLNQLGGLVTELGGTRVFLVTDPGLQQAGHAQHGLESLNAAGLHVTMFTDVQQNPTTDDVDRALAVAREANVDLIVGLGGGSSMDCAKGVNFLLSNGGRMEDYWGVGKATKPMLPMIAVPTTSGTGSEAQSFALIANSKTHMKMACGDKKAACKIAILDPELTVSMPASVTAATGVDAISHAVESYVSTSRNPVSQLFSRQSWQLTAKSFRRVMQRPTDIDGRGQMQLGAYLAGAAIENAMLGAAHACANPLTAHYEITHGVAVGIMLPHIIRYNAAVVGRLYGDLAVDCGLCAAKDARAGELLADFVRELIAESGQATSLAPWNIHPDSLSQLAEEASKQWTGNFNPRPVDQQSLKEIYECAM